MTEAIDALGRGEQLDCAVADCLGLVRGRPGTRLDGKSQASAGYPSTDWNDAMRCGELAGLFEACVLARRNGRWFVYRLKGGKMSEFASGEHGPQAVSRGILRIKGYEKV